jgi:hypothetical protein
MVAGALIPGPSLQPGQYVRASYGYRVRTSQRATGWLILTPSSLIFETADWFGLHWFTRRANFVSNVANLAGVHKLRGDAFDAIPFSPVIGISVASGEQVFFQLADYADWMRLLEPPIHRGMLGRHE